MTPQFAELYKLNEYLAVDSGGNVSDLSLRVIAAWLECFPDKLSWCRNEHPGMYWNNIIPEFDLFITVRTVR